MNIQGKLFSILLAALSAGTAQAYERHDFLANMDFGKGFDRGIADVKPNVCVKYTQISSPTHAQDIDFRMERLIDKSHVWDALDISGAVAAVSGLYNFGGKFSYAAKSDIQTFSDNFLITTKVDNLSRDLAEVDLKPEYALIARTDPLRFRKLCGDTYVQSIITGGEFVGLVSFTTRDATESELVHAEFEAHGPNFDVSGQYEASTNAAFNAIGTRIRVLRKGNAGSETPMTLEQMFEEARAFPAKVAGDDAYSYKVILVNYDRLNSWPSADETNHAYDVMSRLALKRSEFETVQSDVDYIQANPGQFRGAATLSVRRSLESTERQIADQIALINDAVNTCIRSEGETCDEPVTADASEIRWSLPLRYAGECMTETRGLGAFDRINAYTHTRGDTEMGGNNPSISLLSTLALRDHEIEENVSITMVEGKSDWTTFVGSGGRTLNRIPVHCLYRDRGATKAGRINGRGGKDNHNPTWFAADGGHLRGGTCLSDTRGGDSGKLYCKDLEYRDLGFAVIHQEESYSDVSALVAMKAKTEQLRQRRDAVTWQIRNRRMPHRFDHIILEGGVIEQILEPVPTPVRRPRP